MRPQWEQSDGKKKKIYPETAGGSDMKWITESPDAIINVCLNTETMVTKRNSSNQMGTNLRCKKK